VECFGVGADRKHLEFQADTDVHDVVPNSPVLQNYTVLNGVEVQRTLHAVDEETDYEEEPGAADDEDENNMMYM
jgi:hypothetical protein